MSARHLFVAILAAACVTAGACSSSSSAVKPTTTTAPSPEALAAAAYVWGVPLVISTRTMQTLAGITGVNRLYNQQQLSGPMTRLIVAPNVDTLYSVAVLDLRNGPLALTVPNPITNRYWTYEVLDPYTEAFAYIGTRATRGEAGTWVFTPPGWSGSLPTGAHQIAAPTPQLFLLGRFLVDGPTDLASAVAAMQPITLQPLGTPATIPPIGSPPGTPQSVPSLGGAFYDELGDALAVNPPTAAADRAALTRFASLGIGAGQHPYASGDASQRAVLERGSAAGQARVGATVETRNTAKDGWVTRLDLGRYGANFGLRAAVAEAVWGANVPEEAVYPASRIDNTGNTYDGAHTYVMHFDPGREPPANAFWSVTMYGPDRFLVANPLNRYALGDRSSSLTHNADGSLDLYVAHDPPAGHESNWLPAPAGPFTLLARIYLPKPTVLDGSYRLPPVRRVN
ncbi:MAG: DUF1254 domain-containing protein [Acidimicrobiia bacterium]